MLKYIVLQRNNTVDIIMKHTVLLVYQTRPNSFPLYNGGI